jgi:cell division protein FtsN
VSDNDRRLGVRDYKRSPRASLNIDRSQLRGFALGLGLGLAVAAVVYIGDHRVRAATAAATVEPGGAAAAAMLRPTPQQRAPDDLGLPPIHAAAPQHPAAQQHAPTVSRFDFYQMLPRAQVLVATHEHPSHVAAAAPVEQPGTYMLQIGSYRDGAVAERVRGQAAHIGISATVERVTVGSEVWHRVRVGPLRDLTALNRMRRQLQDAGLGSLVVRVED